jgi:phytoene dehydrogenase-like protein
MMGIKEGKNPRLDGLTKKVEAGWGAAMLYITLEPPAGAGAGPKHLELIQDGSAPYFDGNHIFCSISGAMDEGRAPEGLRTMTVSTHVPIEKLRAMTDEMQAAYIEEVHRRMRAGIDTLAPQWAAGIKTQMTASPRTFARFTRRSHGCVGGIPRHAGMANYRQLLPVEPSPGLFMVGDTVFPGQSTLATSIGGMKVAKTIERSLKAS